jgi:crotonobetainyl-CoA:carnitine CoA-transferase CaiB-like acyl-CoA transferase
MPGASGTCDDLIVVELGAGSVASAEAGMLLADNGARVVKVEPPEGDRLRQASPSGWLVWNRGKESWVADLRTAEGRQTVKDLVLGADVVIEAFEPGRAASWGLSYSDLRDRCPGLVHCSIKGFGSTGPYARLKAYDAVVIAKAGLLNRGNFAFREGPVFSGALLASNGAAQMAVASIMAALVVRDRTGKGQSVETTLYQGLNPIDYFFSYHYQLVQRAAEEATRSGRPPMTEAPALANAGATRYGATACASDGRWLTFSSQLPHQARALMEVLGLESLLLDPRFKDMPAFPTADDAEAWSDAIWHRVKERTADEWLEIGRKNDDLPFEALLSSEEALDHPQLRHNGNVVTVIDPTRGPIEQIGPIASFSRTPSRIERSAPDLGVHGEIPPVQEQGSLPATVPTHPLSGITIVEFGYFYAMPYGVTLAGGLGARVIKIEDHVGDPMRWSFGLPEWGGAKTTEGKESISLDLRTDAGQKIAHEIVSRADVFVQGFRPGVDARCGLDYETLSAVNPRLVYLHGAGYGSSGPLAHRPIYAGVANAVSGAAHRQAGRWIDPELCAGMTVPELQAVVGPRLSGLGEGDASASLAVFTALMLALRHQQRTGEGQHVSTNMLNGNVMGYTDDFVRYADKPPLPEVDGEQLGLGPTYRLYQASDGWVMFAAVTDTEWQAAVTGLGRAHLALDPRFRDAAARRINGQELADELAEAFAKRSADEWEESLTAVGVGCARVGAGGPTVSCTDPVLREMGLVVEADHPSFGPMLRYAPAASFSLTPPRIAAGSLFAQHTAAILEELGYSDAAVADLARQGVVHLPA